MFYILVWVVLALVLGEALNERNRRAIVSQILIPTATYGLACWSSVAKTRLIDVRRKISMAAKTCLRLPRRYPTDQLYDRLGTVPFEDLAAAARKTLRESLLAANDDNLGNLATQMALVWPESN